MNNFASSFKLLLGITILILLSIVSSSFTLFLDKRYESVAVHSSSFPFILKLTPVRSGLFSLKEVAKVVCSTIVLNSFAVNVIGFPFKSKSIFGIPLDLFHLN